MKHKHRPRKVPDVPSWPAIMLAILLMVLSAWQIGKSLGLL